MSIRHRVARRFVALKALPVDRAAYFRAFEQKLERDVRTVAHCVAVLKKADRDRDDISGYGYVVRELNLSDYDIAHIEDRVKDLEKRFKLGRRIDDLKRLPSVMGLDNFEDDNRALTRFAEQDLRAGLEMMRENEIPAPIVKAYRELVDTVQGIVARMLLLKERLETTQNLKPAATETLYHASIKARELHAKGFASARPEGGGMGLGGSVSDKAGNHAISFTYDLKYALEISRWFKELALVANGEVKASQVLRMADREGVAEETFSRFSGLYSSSVGDRYSGGTTRLTYDGGRWRVIKEVWVPKENRMVEEAGDVDAIFKSKEAVHGLYMSYILSSKYRSNPVLMGAELVIERMEREGTDPRDIGVIEAEIDMTDPDIRHVPAESEYRIPPKAIKRVTRFIG